MSPLDRTRTEVYGLTPDDLDRRVAEAVRRAAAPLEAATGELRRALRAHAGVYDKAALAEMLGVQPRTLEKWVRESGLPCRKVGREPIFLLDEVRPWLAARPKGGEEA